MKRIVILLFLAGWAAGASWGEEARQLGGPEGTGRLSPADLAERGTEFFYDARYADAESLYRQALAGWDRLGPDAAVSRANTAGNLGTVLRVEGRYAEAEPLLVDWLRETVAGRDRANEAKASTSLAALYQAEGRLAKAETYARRADTLFEKSPDTQKSERIDNARILSSVLLEEGRYEEGEAFLRGLLPDLPDRLAVGAYNDLAAAETQQNHFSEAEKMARQALDLARRVLPSSHPIVGACVNNLAQIERFEGRYLEAEKHYREAIGIWQTTLGKTHPDAGKGLMNLAAFYHERGREAGAEDLYREAAGIFEAALGNEHPLALVARNELGEVLRAQRRFAESEKLSRATLEPLERALGENDARVIRALGNYARLLDQTKRSQQAAAVRVRIQSAGFRAPKP